MAHVSKLKLPMYSVRKMRFPQTDSVCGADLNADEVEDEEEVEDEVEEEEEDEV